MKTWEIVVHADVGGVLVTPRLLTCKELRGERATYTHSGKRDRRVFTQSREQREGPPETRSRLIDAKHTSTPESLNFGGLKKGTPASLGRP